MKILGKNMDWSIISPKFLPRFQENLTKFDKLIKT